MNRVKKNQLIQKYGPLVAEHLDRAMQAKAQGEYLKESIHKELAQNLRQKQLNERGDDFLGIDPNKNFIMDEWLANRLQVGCSERQLTDVFGLLLNNRDFRAEWDKQYGNKPNSLEQFYKDAIQRFQVYKA